MSGTSHEETTEVPKFAQGMLTTDMQGLGPDGKATGQKATFTGASMVNATAEKAAEHQMKLTEDEQAILDGRDGPEMAKLMKIQVVFGNTFGAEKLVDLGGAPHSNLYPGAPYLGSLIKMLDECAKAGLKAYAPYTVNPRPYDCFNVQNNEKEMQIVYEGYPLQKDLDWVHARLGAPDLNKRTCACYVKEVGNAPEPGTMVAWAESSAVNYGNSVLGIRTNRNGAGIDLICALTGKAPYFGLMTDEGRQAKWLIDVKTSKTPDWGVLGTAVGRKVVEDVPLYTGIDNYFDGGQVTEDNLHLLKAMGSASAASGSVGLYHVENVTPEGKAKGRKLLVEGYQTYVYDDAEEQKTIKTFGNLWPDQDGDPTAAFIGCPHNTFFELKKWGTLITEALEKAGKKKTAIPVYMFCANVVRNAFVEAHGELAGKMLAAGMISTPMCGVTWAGTKGFSDRVRGVTNSAKTRNYTSVRYYPDQTLVDIIVTGKVPT
ncbi:MAG: aconitase X catalytic domain-containing protein [Actinomycetia bacterium]|nr:aconitase X catalytic domain-containing protein [Actinomycetes bacterium]